MSTSKASRVPKGVCRLVFTPGGCRFGRNCRFVHPDDATNKTAGAVLSESGQNNKTGRENEEKNRTRDGLIQWRFQIPLQIRISQPLGPRLSFFLQDALSLIGNDPGVTQEVITALASEGGLLRLQELLNMKFDTMPDEKTRVILQDQLLPFFKIITHSDVATSIILEDRIGTIYNYLYGRQGERGLAVFTFVRNALTAPQLEDMISLSSLEPILLAFSNMIDMNSHALVNDELRPLGDFLLDVCGQLEQVDVMYLRRLTTRIGRRLGIGSTIEEVTAPHDTAAMKAKFVLPVDPPGSLSPAGPRHDNDHVEIKDIRVLPTISEINAIRSPYLPSKDPLQLHLPGIRGLLDRHFRLLREDTVGQLRDAIAAELSPSESVKDKKTRTYTYHDLTMTNVVFSRWKGLQLHVRFRQPPNIRSMTLQARKDWWEHTKRLSVDSLVCVLDQHDSVTFCTVSELSHASTEKPRSDDRHDDREKDPGRSKNMFNEANFVYIQLQLADIEADNILDTLQRFHMSSTKYRLVEFPGVLLPSFLPTLQALKRMSLDIDLPFADFLAPKQNSELPMVAPLYALRAGFEFELQPAMNIDTFCKLSLSRSFDLDSFKTNSLLDGAQAEALVSALQSSLALIQGPPGTGKSFTGITLIKVLLKIAKRARLGPILCVCFTNHALDQLLEDLVTHGVKQIIRIGSRSKSEMLEQCNLRHVMQNVQLTRTESKERWEIYQDLESYERSIDTTLGRLAHVKSVKNVRFYLRTYHPKHHDQLFEDHNPSFDSDGFEQVDHAQSKLHMWLYNQLKREAVEDSQRPITTLVDADLFSMNRNERSSLYQHWLDDIRKSLHEQLADAVVAHQNRKLQLDRIRQNQELRCLQEANVIGITTTGLARQLDLLRNVQSKVLVCEEAGEVLEAHILTALLPSLEHVILIGDHLQLPPHIQNYNLSRASTAGQQYSLDVSLFERLVTPDSTRSALPMSVLEIQRRMHPSISTLVRSTLYPALRDHPHVGTYPGVAGMKHRLYWFDHQHHELAPDPNITTTSHVNHFEIEMVVALVTHLVRQGVYAANDIAVLTPYLGQLLKLRKILRNQFEITMSEGDEEELERQALSDDDDVPTPKNPTAKTALLNALAVSTIDNFQGNEAKVVVITLVRSNKERNCGFLKASNRINVLLSRAKHGMYIIGDSETAESAVMWKEVIDMLRAGGSIGPELELQCARHPETPIHVSKPEDFVVFSPEGGCGRICDERLECGHRDVSKCHSEVLHKAVRCLEPCVRQIKGCNHGCPKVCGDACAKHCEVVLTNTEVELPCGHVKINPTCWQAQHPELVRCDAKVDKTVPGCEHQIVVECFVSVQVENYECKATCNAELTCGHNCLRPCHRCTKRAEGAIVSRDHSDCKRKCDRKFNNCSHSCQLKCHGESPCRCTAKCENFCEHSRCGKGCEEACAPCAETTCASSRCTHTTPCSMPCAAPCDWLPCGRRCEKLLICGHRCPTVCGEICPSPQYCQICANQDVKNATVDFIMMSTYGEVDLDEDPCVIPACGHILTISSMDGQMEMSKHYSMEENTVTGIRESSTPFSMDELKVCGTCRGSLRNIFRYGRIVRRALLDESTKKFIRRTGLQTIDLTAGLHSEQKKLEASISNARLKAPSIKPIKPTGTLLEQVNSANNATNHRYKGIQRLRAQIKKHFVQVQIEEQPYRRVLDLVSHAQRQNDNVGHMELDVSILQTRESVQALSLLHRCDLAILSDLLDIMKEAGVEIDLQEYRTSCDELIQMASQAKQPLQEVEGHLFYAQYCAAQRQTKTLEGVEYLTQTGKEHLLEARNLCQRYPGTTRRVHAELDDIEKMLRNSTFYTTVRDDEYRAVMAAMAQEFRGGGHWYTCANGHPFTVGECGMPMQQARCPQCDAPIGGTNHQSAEGVTHAADLERRFGQLNI